MSKWQFRAIFCMAMSISLDVYEPRVIPAWFFQVPAIGLYTIALIAFVIAEMKEKQ